MAIEYFCCYHSYARKLAKLSDQEVGRLFRALIQYSDTGKAQELTGRESVAFDFIADDIDRAREAYQAKCEQNKKNRMSTTVNDRQRPITTDSKDKDKDETNIHPPIGGRDTPARAKPPTFEQVQEVAKLRGCPECAKPFFDYYAVSGWRDSEGKPCAWNWQQKLVAWQQRQERMEKQRRSGEKASGNVFMDMLREEEGHGQG